MSPKGNPVLIKHSTPLNIIFKCILFSFTHLFIEWLYFKHFLHPGTGIDAQMQHFPRQTEVPPFEWLLPRPASREGSNYKRQEQSGKNLVLTDRNVGHIKLQYLFSRNTFKSIRPLEGEFWKHRLSWKFFHLLWKEDFEVLWQTSGMSKSKGNQNFWFYFWLLVEFLCGFRQITYCLFCYLLGCSFSEWVYSSIF